MLLATAMSESKRSLISTIHIFAGLDEAVVDLLAEACRELHVAAGETVVEQGAVAREMFVIARGRVEVIQHAGTPDKVVLAKLGHGEFFGEMCILDCMPRAATVRALEPTALYSLKNADLLQIFRRWPDQYGILMLNISRDLCRRLRQVHDLLCAALRTQNASFPTGQADEILRIE
jgi:CRP/FNR family transcriptional regulator, cyclic AMP receptor protein